VNSALWIGVGPAERTGLFLIGTDIAAELASQVGDGGKDPAVDDVALDFGKP